MLDFEPSLWLIGLAIAGGIVLFALGWLARSLDVRGLIKETRAIPTHYFQGLSHVLNDQPERAIDALIAASKEHPQSAELQFALGKLYRRRGDHDRAASMHERLRQRSDLSTADRRRVDYELALDFLKAGLLSYADEALVKLNRAMPDADVQKKLLELLVQEKDWARAVAIARELASTSGVSLAKEIGHFHCELATERYVHGKRSEAYAELSAALAACPTSVRANLLRGEWLAADTQHEAAIEAYCAIEQQSAAHLGFAARGIYQSYKALGRSAEGLALLADLQTRYPSFDFLLAIVEATAEVQGAQPAYQLLRNEVRKNPSLVGLDKLLEAQLAHWPALPASEAAVDERKADLLLIKKLVASHASVLSIYLCGGCGFRGKEYHWHCPACNRWETFAPKRTAELETAERHLLRIRVDGQSS